MTKTLATIGWIAALSCVSVAFAQSLVSSTYAGSRDPLYNSKAGYWSYVAGPLYYARIRIFFLVTGERGMDKSKVRSQYALTRKYELLADYEYRNATETKPPPGWEAIRHDVIEAASAMRVWSRETSVMVYGCSRAPGTYMGEGKPIDTGCFNPRAMAAYDQFIATGTWLDRACADVNKLDPGLCGPNAFMNGPAVPRADECWPRDFSDWAYRSRHIGLLRWPDFPSDFRPCVQTDQNQS